MNLGDVWGAKGKAEKKLQETGGKLRNKLRGLVEERLQAQKNFENRSDNKDYYKGSAFWGKKK